MKTAFMFPGQGSQSIGMMAELLAEYAVARQVFDEASSAIGLDLQAIACHGPAEEINSTAVTQPIVLTASMAMWRVWTSLTEKRPDYVCGHSLGEYTALVASGVLTLADAVRLVRLRGQLMQDAVPAGAGAMAALLGMDDAAVIALCADAAQGEVVAAANFNSPGQVVISGAIAALERAIALAKARGVKRATLLSVSVPCHCELLQPAGESLAAEMATIQFKAPTIPIVQNVSATEVSELAQLKINLIAHLHKPVLWAQSISYLVRQGVTTVVECGPGKVLTGLNKRIDGSLQSLSMSDPASLAQVLSVL